MQIGLIGYGKMGKSVERQALIRSHDIVILNDHSLDSSDLDCVIDFTHAHIAPKLITQYLKAGIPVVSGTTGWNEQLPEIEALCKELNGAFCWSPNYSIGMHLTFRLNTLLAQLMNDHEQYDPQILEIHHKEKKDSPSGTAISLADQIIDKLDRKSDWTEVEGSESASLFIASRREEDVKGIHRVTYKSSFDTISLRHHALSRDGFALGAVLAAEWLVGKTGCYQFEDVLDFPR